VLRQGLISAFLHGIVEYAGAALLIAAPFLFAFDSDAATALAIVAGVVVIVIGASSDLPTGLSRTLPVAIHVVVDFVVAGVLIASPFLFGFSEEGTPTAFFIVFGVAEILLTVATRFLPERRE
jgi:hypothetical protein